MTRLSIKDAHILLGKAFAAQGVSPQNAEPTIKALIAAECDGQKGHGLMRVPSYLAQVKSGKINGKSTARITNTPDPNRGYGQTLRIDAGHGFAYPALELARREGIRLARQKGISCVTIYNSHHFGQGAYHVEPIAHAGLIALLLGNSPKAIGFWGSATPAMGTNPIVFAAPIPNAPPLVIDLALAVGARGKVVAAQNAGKSIPEGWSLGPDGEPTTDPQTALQGSMLPIGRAKGAALALMVEVMAAALSGGQFGYEASSLFSADGPPPSLGQTLILIDPDPLSGGHFGQRMTDMAREIEQTEGARLPGQSRLVHRKQAALGGINIADALYADITALGREV